MNKENRNILILCIILACAVAINLIAIQFKSELNSFIEFVSDYMKKRIS